MTYTDTNIEELGTKLISSENPAGVSVKYHPDFEQLQAEIQKTDSLTGGIVDWRKVVELSISILSKESKDILVVGYLCLGLFNLPKIELYPLRGFKGLKSGLACYRKILDNFWEGLFPEIKRMRARISAITFLTERLGKAIGNYKINDLERKDIEACQEEVNLLSAAIDERLKGESPGLGDLRRAIEEQLNRISSEKNVEEKSVTPSSNRVVDIGISPGESRKIVSPKDADRILKESSEMIRQVSFYMRSQRNTNPIPYRLIRIASWLEINDLPPNTNNKTMIPSIQKHIPKLCEEHIKKGNWDGVLDIAEANIPEAPFLLDLNYYSMLALSHLGKPYKEAELAVCEELSSFINRLPEIMNLQFSDGTPFANDETRTWIEGYRLTTNSSSSVINQPVLVEDSKRSGRLEEAKIKAKEFISEGKLRDAIAHFQQELEVISLRRERFLFKFELAKICLEAGETNLSVTLMESLDSEINRFSLEEWEPDLTHDILYLLWHSLNRLSESSSKSSPDINQRIDDVYKRLCRLNPFSAFELGNKKVKSWI